MAVDPVTGVADAVTMLLSVVEKTMDFIPNYEQRKKKEYRTLRTAYENEKKKAWDDIDDNLVGIYRDRLMLFIAIYNNEISGKTLPPVQ